MIRETEQDAEVQNQRATALESKPEGKEKPESGGSPQ